MSNRIPKIKKQIEKECEKNKEQLSDWFYDIHLLNVEKFSEKLLAKIPAANREVVMLGVWLHDLQRIRGLKGDHQKIGASEARKVMEEYGYDQKIINKVCEIILSHSCSNRQPKSLEGKILATADAMTHYFNDFFLRVAVTGRRDLKEYKKWVMEKLDRNYNKKIFFPFAKNEIKKRHELFKKVFTMDKL